MKKQVSFFLRGMVCIIVMLALFAGITLFYGIEKTDLVSVEGRTFEKAKVTRIVKDNVQEDGTRVGEQQIMVELLSGPYKGEVMGATSSDGNLFGAACKVGMRVTVIVSATDAGRLVSVYSRDRQTAIYGYVAIFLLLICLIGGKNGVKSVLGLLFTFVCLVYLYMPLIYKGHSPFWVAVLVAAVTTVVTMYLIGGFTKKTLSSILGTVLGVLLSGVSAHLFGRASGIGGYNVSDVETLLFVGQHTSIQVGELLFSGILIASLGAVMDVAMSISSTIAEIHENNPELGRGRLFLSGLSVGRDMMGTMSNTLILAFVGGSLSTLLVDYAYDLPYLQLINSNTIGIEIMRGISGSIGVVMTVPFVAAIAAVLMTTGGGESRGMEIEDKLEVQ